MTGSDDAEILLVEDDPDEAELALSALKKGNFTNKIAVVSDGQDALHYIFATGPYAERGEIAGGLKLILLDLKLPKVDGLEVLRKLKADERTKAIPVVMLTSSQENRDTVASYALGVNSYMVKPIGFDKFAHAIETLGFYWLFLNKLPD